MIQIKLSLVLIEEIVTKRHLLDHASRHMLISESKSRMFWTKLVVICLTSVSRHMLISKSKSCMFQTKVAVSVLRGVDSQ